MYQGCQPNSTKAIRGDQIFVSKLPYTLTFHIIETLSLSVRHGFWATRVQHPITRLSVAERHRRASIGNCHHCSTNMTDTRVAISTFLWTIFGNELGIFELKLFFAATPLRLSLPLFFNRYSRPICMGFPKKRHFRDFHTFSALVTNANDYASSIIRNRDSRTIRLKPLHCTCAARSWSPQLSYRNTWAFRAKALSFF